jgi:hypothetical protein
VTVGNTPDVAWFDVVNRKIHLKSVWQPKVIEDRKVQDALRVLVEYLTKNDVHGIAVTVNMDTSDSQGTLMIPMMPHELTWTEGDASIDATDCSVWVG